MPGQLVFFALLFGAMYMLMVRPQQQRARRQRELISALSVGDQVITAGGMIGEIVAEADDRVTVRLAPGVEVPFLRGAISQRLVEDEPALDAPDDVVDLDHPDLPERRAVDRPDPDQPDQAERPEDESE